MADGSLGRWKIPAARAGRRARTARTKRGRGPLAPAHALVLRALRARKTPPPRRRAPQRLPPPPRQHTAVGPTAVARGDAGSRFSVGGNPGGGRRLGAKRPERASPGPKAPSSLFRLAGRGGGPQGRPLGRQTPPPQRPTERPSGAAAFRGRGHRPRPRNMPAAGLARQRAGGLCPPAAFAVRKGRCASPLKRLPSTPLLTGLPPRFFRHWRRSALPPLRYVFHQRQKGNAKARPFGRPSHAPSTARKKAVATASRAVRHGAYASCVGGRCPRFCGSSPGDRRSAGRTCRKGTGGPPAFQRGKGRY